MSEQDPLTALLMENPPKDVFDLRRIMDGFMLAVNADLPEIGDSKDDVLIEAHPGQDLTVDIHRPSGEGPFPILVYLHGGGWILGSPKTHRRIGYRFAERGYLVFNVHYRLAPEAPFPAAFDDCVTALAWVIEHAESYGGDLSRLSMGGDSAGGNLTAAVATHAEFADVLKAILLIYPAMDFATMDMESGEIPGSEENMAEVMVNSYIGHDLKNLIVDSRVSPIHVAQNLPPALITCGTNDTLLEVCRKTAQIMDEHGRDVETDFYEGMPHGFCQLEEVFPQALQSIEKMTEFLDRRVARPDSNSSEETAE